MLPGRARTTGALTVVEAWGVGFEASASGVLRIADDCVVPRLGDGAAADDSLLLVWPDAAASWDVDRGEITFASPQGGEVVLSDGTGST